MNLYTYSKPSYWLRVISIVVLSTSFRFTARMSELLVVLGDMEKGVYERTMVSTVPAESAEDGTGIYELY